MKKSGKILVLITVCFLVFLVACVPPPPPKQSFRIISGSENKTLMPIILEFGNMHDIQIEMEFLGSLDIMRLIEGKGDKKIANYDAVWPANKLWLDFSLDSTKIKHAQSIWTSPVVLGIRAEKAREIGLEKGGILRMDDLISLSRDAVLEYMMTSSTQSNSGATAFLGFFSTICGCKPGEIESRCLEDENVLNKMKDLLEGIERTSGSSNWLKETFLARQYQVYDALINYEALLIEVNQEERNNRNPVEFFYPEGFISTDSTLAYIDNGYEFKEEFFLDLQKYLRSPAVQEKIVALGRRPAKDLPEKLNLPIDVFQESWGIKRNINAPVYFISNDRETVFSALSLYQKKLRKPTFTIYCIDFSASMGDAKENKIRQVKKALDKLFDPTDNEHLLIQPHDAGITVFLPFNENAPINGVEFDEIRAEGSKELGKILAKIKNLPTAGRTDIYGALETAINILKRDDAFNSGKYLGAVTLFTDGIQNITAEESLGDTGQMPMDSGSCGRLDLQFLNERNVPVFSLFFGVKDKSANNVATCLSEATRGKEWTIPPDSLDAALRKIVSAH